MTGQKKGIWSTIVTLSIGIVLGVGTAAWMTQPSPMPETQTNVESPHDRRLAQLEQAMTALTQSLQAKQTKNTSPEPTCVTAPANDDASRQALAQIIREEVRQALANASPEAQRAREEALANAEVLNSPENRAAYQSASDVVHGALAAGRWTEDDKQTFRTAFLRLTNDQRSELMDILAPAINDGEIAVEVSGPLF